MEFLHMQNFGRHRLWSGVVTIALFSAGCTASQQTAPSPVATPSVSSPSPLPPPNVSATPPSPQASISPESAGKVTLADGRISFTLPAGFTPLTQEEIALKFPRTGNPPSHAYGNAERNVTIAVTFSQAKLTPAQLPELKAALRPQISKAVPNLEWIKDEIIPVNNTQWVHYEFVSQAIDTKVHNDAYFTSFDGRMMGFNFNSTVAKWDAAKDELMKTRDSIVIQ
ncbi:MAG: hypothetical protein MUC48_25365 [Leptolyngbya sp. Prado105]|jgi:hypothetical protein|nr:hypothetical protein [Leptolyngbya sp. Prado105]